MSEMRGMPPCPPSEARWLQLAAAAARDPHVASLLHGFFGSAGALCLTVETYPCGLVEALSDRLSTKLVAILRFNSNALASKESDWACWARHSTGT